MTASKLAKDALLELLLLCDDADEGNAGEDDVVAFVTDDPIEEAAGADDCGEENALDPNGSATAAAPKEEGIALAVLKMKTNSIENMQQSIFWRDSVKEKRNPELK